MRFIFSFPNGSTTRIASTASATSFAVMREQEQTIMGLIQSVTDISTNHFLRSTKSVQIRVPCVKEGDLAGMGRRALSLKKATTAPGKSRPIELSRLELWGLRKAGTTEGLLLPAIA